MKLEIDEQLFQSVLVLMQKAPLPYEVTAPVIQAFINSVKQPQVPAILQQVAPKKRGRPRKTPEAEKVAA